MKNKTPDAWCYISEEDDTKLKQFCIKGLEFRKATNGKFIVIARNIFSKDIKEFFQLGHEVSIDQQPTERANAKQ